MTHVRSGLLAAAVLLLVPPLLLVGSSASATVYYYIKENPNQPPSQLAGPWWTANVLEISSDSTPTPPNNYNEVTEEELEDMGYLTPTESWQAAHDSGYSDDYEVDGHDKRSWINVQQGSNYRVIQYGSATGHNPLPSTLGLGYKSYANGAPLVNWPGTNQFYTTWG